ncbi:histidinol-phosphate transaminase [Candidatus Formimonas warabiya]|uniref:Histidinol-phosphate aminotransferase n=1 Tax=Formimonas warabiya TaxID=1761012 RepID=A0A3G1KYK6_FORW1|nr:histidinol-phosphate transaminase [Candidatus Formimonas warabiya]ATW27490.1 histidinol-phosphate transaminase [Candidatus Formimonas warabiya]
MKRIEKKALARRGIDGLAAYVPGKPVEEAIREYGLKEMIRLASNENPLGTSPKALEAMKQALDDAYLYPEGSSTELRRKVAATFGIEADMVIFGNGADNILLMIAQAFIDEDDEVIVGDPTFSVYETVTRIMGGRVVKVPLRDFTYDLSAIVRKITPQTKLIFVCNPNNPTGSLVTEKEVAQFMDQVPAHCVVVFDEAYAEFVQERNYPQTIRYIHHQKNVLMVRTLSKIFGLAGVRIGYALGPQKLINVLCKVAEPFPVNRVAQAGGLAALDDGEFVKRVLEVNEEGKHYLYEQFSQLGMSYVPSHTNFVFVHLGMDGKLAFQKLWEKGIVIRPGDIWNLPEFSRITIGTAEQNEKLVKALAMIKKENAS